MKSDLSKVQVGDRIWTIQQGWVTVESVDYHETYPISAGNQCHTIDGKHRTSDTFPSAFTFNPFEQPQPFEGYWAMVSHKPINEDNKGVKRFVFMEKNGMFYAWNFAETDEQLAREMVVVTWEHAQRIPEPAPVPEYTVEELTAIVGHEFKIKN
jgi:hypothetical protein